MHVSVSRRMAIAGAALAAVIAIGVTAVLVFTGEAPRDAPLMRPAAEKDFVPEMRVFTAADVPENCGVEPETVATYAPGDHHEQGRTSCHWYSLNSGTVNCPGICPASHGDRERVLNVVVTPAERPSRSDTGSAAGAALRALNPASVTRVAAGRTPRPVVGLGDEGYFSYSAGLSNPGDEGGSLAFRAGTAVVSVTYDGRTWGRKNALTQVPEAEARRAVFAAATDVAKGLGVASTPAFGDPMPTSGQPPARRVPRPCDLVPRRLAERLAPGAVRERGTVATAYGPQEGVYGTGEDTCVWDSMPTCCLGDDTDHRPERHLAVTVRSVREWRPGIGTWLSRRDFLAAYHDAREGRGRSRFQRVRGLGDEAYAVFHEPVGIGAKGDGAKVAFRYRNVIVTVDYTGGEHGSPGPDEAVDAAYTVAVRAHRALRA